MKIAKLRVPPTPAQAKSATAKGKKFVNIGYVKPQIVSEDDPRVKGFIEIFDNQGLLEKKMTKRKNIWANYKFDYRITDDIKSQYESFFSGFLHYYDTELRNGMSNHTMWCNWHKKGDNDVVTVYLHPAPLRHKLKRSATDPNKKTAQDYVLLMEQKNKETLNTIYNSSWSPGVSGLQSDPPNPSGPPPPSA